MYHGESSIRVRNADKHSDKREILRLPTALSTTTFDSQSTHHTMGNVCQAFSLFLPFLVNKFRECLPPRLILPRMDTNHLEQSENKL